ncbi:MAG: GNAT family N-acetyltransferase [Sphingomonadales bacterium]|nr:GNAT family N-acetyltransferase [Sphingomonadales bacterium]RIK95075.1 MAG: hypothetical protein DCC73_01430 [Pseudomonadota bacterium]
MSNGEGTAAAHDGSAASALDCLLSDAGIQVVLAETPALLERVFRLRYQVYCMARGFEDPAQQLSGLEQDRYDEFSVHSLLLDGESGDDLGSVRLVLPNTVVSLPSYAIAPEVKELADRDFPAATTAEASRFLRAVDAGRPSRWRSAEETLALMAAIVRMSAEHGMTHVLALVTEPMLRLLRRYRLNFRPLGEPVAFNGLRYPTVLDLTTDLDVVAAERPEVWRILTAGGALYSRSVPSL